ncbi:MAG: bifunctional 5,10-methylene-tetrahydrofolate dehydrogenase/5,10-methylene-tetrahydrofolate cyclohydrolase [Bacteroidales bacterium]|nr:bifunctional 5,10-methylene-tetrahydrofolate dehydrogenase/5,10-methylene-tetrahydrofolate cyclohydrolase [Bacteroidales bacterium]MBO7764412.1 bifunctional 5,10-methylene-tetrahydrofolate dehydrogenase/5,10-methylene-tetrahydrofolate cyclohydrolase [Bacteroidales bacterium]MBQ2243477.1 bifunctional 5,10-methylene-tetrahydrofolate dehydrogenase/5,10-methylene-tetrahydrofolate cyclohydrolase [Bacteroidales bacterium]
MILLDGKKTSEAIKQQIASEVAEMVANGLRRPKLVAILVGEDGASKTYVNNKEKACQDVGFDSEVLRYPDTITEGELLAKIREINEDEGVDGLIVQLPLPKHIDEDKVINTISPLKDVDGFHASNVGKMVLGEPSFVSATPYGIMAMLEHYNIDTKGKHCVVLGRSNIVGRPIANLLSLKGNPGDCTVTICHSRTKNIEQHTRMADIIIAAIGTPHFLKEDMVKEGAVVVDVGITRVPDATRPKGYRIVGDVDFEHVAPKCSYITPVPGGVGPMTIVSLMRNTLQAMKQHK